MTISVRVASAEDIDYIVKLNRDVQLLHAALEPCFFKSNFDNEQVAGFFAAKLALPRIYIHHLSVRAGARRLGIASALLRQVEAEALISGIKNIALDTWAANGSARGFFEACGFTAFNLSLGKRLT